MCLDLGCSALGKDFKVKTSKLLILNSILIENYHFKFCFNNLLISYWFKKINYFRLNIRTILNFYFLKISSVRPYGYLL